MTRQFFIPRSHAFQFANYIPDRTIPLPGICRAIRRATGVESRILSQMKSFHIRANQTTGKIIDDLLGARRLSESIVLLFPLAGFFCLYISINTQFFHCLKCVSR